MIIGNIFLVRNSDSSTLRLLEMRLFLVLVVALFLAVNAQIQICKYMFMDPTPAVTTGLFKCTEHAVEARICSTIDDHYQLQSCEQKGGGAVNILTEFGVRYLLLGDAYSAHYLAVQA